MLRGTTLVKRSAMLLLVFGVLLGAACAQTESVLHNFCATTGCTDGARPYAGLVFDQQGNLYGTTEQGGAQENSYGSGLVFKVNPKGEETVVYTFCAQTKCTDGEWPLAGLVFNQNGNMYGTTYYGGSSGEGTVFELSPNGKEKVLFNFCPEGGFSCTDGQNPWAGVTLDQKGNLYGTTFYGGANYNKDCDFGCGIVYKLTPEGGERVLYSFCAKPNCADGANPYAGVVLDQKGNMYGTAYNGGKSAFCYPLSGCGVVYKLTPEGKQTVLYSFCSQKNCTDGANPQGGLVFDQEGNLYGTTVAGGIDNQTYCLGTCGVVFKITPEGEETVLYSFCSQSGCIDGSSPASGLVFDQQGNLYGTTYYGGAYSNDTCSPYISGCGVVFKLTPQGQETVLYSFCAQANCADGALPEAGVIFDAKGNIYGTTQNDGADGEGVVFKITL
jgi:uncharacterized repeat protein (TIGR03803 family)